MSKTKFQPGDLITLKNAYQGSSRIDVPYLYRPVDDKFIRGYNIRKVRWCDQFLIIGVHQWRDGTETATIISEVIADVDLKHFKRTFR